MVDSKSYEALLNKYNILVSKYNNLIEETDERNNKWVTLQNHWKDTEKKVRELCEMILSKDRDEVNGSDKSYTWRNVTTDDLIAKSKSSYEKYNSNRNSLMKQMADIIEDRSEEIENLKLQIMQMINSAAGGYAASDVCDTTILKDKSTTTTDDKSSEDAEHCEIVTVSEEDSDFIASEEKALADEASYGEKVVGKKIQMLAKSIKAEPSKKEQGIIAKARKDTRAAYVEDLNQISKKLSPEAKDIFELIGAEGISRMNLILDMVQTRNPEKKTTSIKAMIASLNSASLITSENISTPYTPRQRIYMLSDMGKRLYEHDFHKKPVLSEAEKVIAEHDNLFHGYGIIQLGELISQTEGYSDVHVFNRNQAIPIKGSKGKYIPDVMFKYGKYQNYIEYERGNHTQSDFNAKCNKMLQVTRYIQFVVDKQDTLEHISSMVRVWADSKGIKVLQGWHVKICTAIYFRDSVLNNYNSAWQVEYDFNKGNVPLTL